MKYFYVEVDTNDADYVGNVVKVSDKTFKKFLPLIEKIKNFKPYDAVSKGGFEYTYDANFPVDDCCRYDLGEKDPCELYGIDEATLEEFRDAFELYGSDYGFHTITKIQELQIVKTYLNTND